MATNIIEKVKIGSSTDLYALASTAYFICSDPVDQTAKAVSDISGFVLIEGVTIHVKFTNGNTAAQPTLNVSSTGAIPIAFYGNTRTDSTAMNIPAGGVVSFTYSKEGSDFYWVMNSGYNKDTTYTFAGGTNKFTVTPLGGSAQTVNITPSIANNITGSGTNNYLTKFNGANTITNGPALSSAISTQTASTKFLREDGTWAVPSYTAQSHYTASLIVGNANSDQSNEAVTASTTGVFLNLVENSTVRNAHQLKGAGGIEIGSDASGNITFTGKAGTVTSVGVTANGGLATSISSNGAITTSGTIGIAAGGVTNAMLAGSIDNDKLSNKTISINGIAKELGENFSLDEIGIAQAMHFKGTTTTALTDNDTTHTTVTIDDATYTPVAGDVVLYSDAEFVWTGTKWERLGRDSSFLTSYISFGKISISASTGTDAVTANTTQLIAASGNEAFTFKTGNKWLTAAGTNGTSGNDILTIGHALSGVTSGNYGDSSNQTPGYGSTFNVPYISVDAAGHITSISTHTVKIPNSDNTDTKVTQNILATSVTDTYPLLVSYYKTTGTDASATGAQIANRVAAIYVQPSTGTLTATKFVGNGSGLTNLSATAIKTALGTASTTDPTFLHKSGDWKKLKVTVTANTSGSVVTAVGWNAGTQPSFTQGTLAAAVVNNAVLELTNETASTFNKGTYPSLGTISKANLTVGYD